MSDEIPADGTGERGRFYYNHETRRVQPMPAPERRAVDAPYVKRDEIVGGLESWVDGKIYDSKSNLRRSYKEHGVIEKGDERLPPPRAPDPEVMRREIREDVEKAYYDLKYDRVPVSEKEKQQCLEEQRSTEAQKRRERTRWA